MFLRSTSQTNDDSLTFEDEESSDDCSSDLANVQEISYGTPGYWAFKRRQLQEMALKRKQRDRLQVVCQNPIIFSPFFFNFYLVC